MGQNRSSKHQEIAWNLDCSILVFAKKCAQPKFPQEAFYIVSIQEQMGKLTKQTNQESPWFFDLKNDQGFFLYVFG